MGTTRAATVAGTRRSGARDGRGIAVAMLAATLVAAGPARAGQAVAWRGFDEPAPASLTSGEAAEVVRSLVAPGQRTHLIVQFDAPPEAAPRQVLSDAGVELLACLGAAAFFASVNGDLVDVHAIAGVETLRSVRPIHREHRLHPMLREAAHPAWAVVGETIDLQGQPEPLVVVQVLFQRDVSRREGRRVAAEVGGEIRGVLSTVNALLIELPAGAVEQLAARHEVQWIEPPLPRFTALNDSNREATQAGIVQDSPYKLDGSGIVVAVLDIGGGLAAHQDFAGRLTVRDDTSLSNHATHVAGTIGGNGVGSGGQYRGMAPNVTIESYGFEPVGPQIFLYENPADFEHDYADAVLGRQAVLGNNSIGTNVSSNPFPCSIMGDYGIMSAVIDAVVRGGLGAPVRLVWAVGNERSLPACGETYYTTAPPAGAKNHISVGALYSNDHSMTSFTSWGPVDDGRLKPDLCAPGCEIGTDGGVTSPGSDGDYSVQCGTSMAAPTVTGLAALLMEDFRIRYPNRPDPLPSTVKTLLVHTALDIEATGPDYRSGYGVAQIQDAIDFMRTGGFLESEIVQGTVHPVKVVVPPGAPEVRITLAWDDAPGTPNVTLALVNNLNLLVIGPGGAYYPWTLDPADPSAPARRTEQDFVNNLEQVVIDAPIAGTYTAYVQGVAVPDGPQRFSLAAGPGLVSTVISLADDPPLDFIEPGVPTLAAIDVRSVGESIVPGTVMAHYDYGGGNTGAVVMSPAGGDRYEAMLPPASCDELPHVHFTATGALSGTATFPLGAPAQAVEPTVGRIIELHADDFESDGGWTVLSDPGLEGGAWERGLPGDLDIGSPSLDADGSGHCLLTGPDSGDVDGGVTRAISPNMNATVDRPMLTYSYWFSNVQGEAPHEDVFLVDVSFNGGQNWHLVDFVGPDGLEAVGGWKQRTISLPQVPGFEPTKTFRVRFTTHDAAADSNVEAAVDAVRVTWLACEGLEPDCPADVNGDGLVDTADVVVVLTEWGPCDGGDCPDVDGDGWVGAEDLVLVLTQWGPCE